MAMIVFSLLVAGVNMLVGYLALVILYLHRGENGVDTFELRQFFILKLSHPAFQITIDGGRKHAGAYINWGWV